jgi:hypothetical protein
LGFCDAFAAAVEGRAPGSVHVHVLALRDVVELNRFIHRAQQIGFLLREIVELPSLRADPPPTGTEDLFFLPAASQIDKAAHLFADHAGPIASAGMYIFGLIIVR